MPETTAAKNRLVIVQPAESSVSETFLRAQAERLPAEVVTVCDFLPRLDGKPVYDQSLRTAARLAYWRLRGVRPHVGWAEWAGTCAYLDAFRRLKPDAVLGQYGHFSTYVMEACERWQVPLVVHFHGQDASRHEILEKFGTRYHELFRIAQAIVVVSQAMRDKLISLGAPPDKLHYNCYGVDCDRFAGANPAQAAPRLLSVARFTEKKGPHLTLLAFSRVLQSCREARLCMIGDGPLLRVCQDLAHGLGISPAVSFLGAQPPEVIQQELRQARAFVQHSVEASDGDSEGTPNTVLEAGASGLPVIATRHAGISDVVVDGKTGILVDERDTQDMAKHMSTMCHDSDFAGRMGAAARQHVAANYSLAQSISRLWSIIEAAMAAKHRRSE